MTITEVMTMQQIRQAGIEALARELGVVGMVRFLQQFETGRGDYSQERHQWLDEITLREAAIKLAQSRPGRDEESISQNNGDGKL